MRYTYKAFHPHQKDHLLLIIDKQPVQWKCIPVLKTSERERERERESFIRNNLHNGGAARERERERALLGTTPWLPAWPAAAAQKLPTAEKMQQAVHHCSVGRPRWPCDQSRRFRPLRRRTWRIRGCLRLDLDETRSTTVNHGETAVASRGLTPANLHLEPGDLCQILWLELLFSAART